MIPYGQTKIKQCDHIDSVSDADFGYWNSEQWGDPPIQEFECEERADFILEIEGYEGTEEVALCAKHAKAVL